MTDTNSLVYGIGLGPGDPSLLTLRARDLLQNLPVLAFPATENGESMAHDIARPHLATHGQKLHFFRMRIDQAAPPEESSQEDSPQEDSYDSCAAWIVSHVERGLAVGIGCVGDPFFHGSFQYICRRLSGHYPIEIIPGISAPLAAACRGLKPIASASMADEDIAQALSAHDSIAFIKWGRHHQRVKALLEKHGEIDKALYAERIGFNELRAHSTKTINLPMTEKLIPLSQTGDEAPYFSLVLWHARGASWHRKTEKIP